MAQDNDGTEAELRALFKAGAYKCRPDAFTLMRRGNGHRCEAHDPQRGMALERDGGKHDVPDDGSVVLCDERNERPRLFAQSVNKIGLF